MSRKIRKGTGKTGSPAGVIGTVGDNYIVKDTPCLIPKENMKFLNAMKQSSQRSTFGDYPNPFNAFWKGSEK